MEARDHERLERMAKEAAERAAANAAKKKKAEERIAGGRGALAACDALPALHCTLCPPVVPCSPSVSQSVSQATQPCQH